MATVEQLIPGDQVMHGSMIAVYICRMKHPVYRGLDQVIWYLPAESSYSFDALHFMQEVGDVIPSTQQDRVDRLQTFLRPRVGE
jgi:hypothetical protein